MAPITTIVHFTLAPPGVDRFLAFWQDHIRPEVSRQPGLVEGTLHRAVDPDGPFQFINVARWESAEHLEAALRATRDHLPQMGLLFQQLGVTISQNNYIETVRYTAAAGGFSVDSAAVSSPAVISASATPPIPTRTR